MATNQLRDPKNRIINIGAPKFKSRESQGVWQSPNSATQLWKIYTTKTTFQTTLNDITRADREGLPVPAFQGILGYQFRKNAQAAWQDAYILQTVFLTGTFFAMSQQGQTHQWNQWLGTLDRTRDRAVLQAAQTAAHTASRINVLDPQGLLDKARREPVMFIDVHLGGSKPGSSRGAEQMREEVDAYIKK